MSIVRTYLCDSCGTKFDKLHFDRNELPPECPGCAAIEARQVPAGFSIGGGNASRAGDLAYDVLEKDYGFSDMKDRVHEGEIGVKTPPGIGAQVQKFWSPPGDVLQAGKAGAAASRAEGSNPLTLVQRVAKARGPSGAKVLCRPINMVR